MIAMAPTKVEVAVTALDAWFDSMRGPDGYGGPVAHWWHQCLCYTGVGRDWRYEGLIVGYTQLWSRSGNRRWLDKACRAADDVVAGQLPNGHFAASCFEQNPASGGTPHEAACDVGLLFLAQAMRSAGHDRWAVYAAAAERNLRSFLVGRLWDDRARSFRDAPNVPSLVPNKAATICDALFLLAEVREDERWIEQYAMPTLDRIVEHQMHGGVLDGAIAQNSFGSQMIEKYFPIYNARCVSALLRGYRWSGDDRLADAALRVMRFLARSIDADGSLPTVIYPDRTVNRFPAWIAPLGDVLRAADEARPYGFDADVSAVRERVFGGQESTGGIRTASGFAAHAGGSPSALPDARDLLPVVGWCDKTFRYLTAHVHTDLPDTVSQDVEYDCVFAGTTMRFVETPELIEVADSRDVRYRWRKGAAWAEVAAPEFWLH